MKDKFFKFATWTQNNWLAIVIFMIFIMMIFLLLIMASWLYGYWSNALGGTKFDLSSCWSGVTVVITGLGGIAALAKAAWTKYSTDSKYNSVQGEKPYESIRVKEND